MELPATDDFVVTLHNGQVVRFARREVQVLSPIEPHKGALLMTGSDAAGRWVLVVRGGEGRFVLNATGIDQKERVILSPELPMGYSGPKRTLVLPKAEDFAGGSYEEQGRYDSARGAFVLDADARLVEYVP